MLTAHHIYYAGTHPNHPANIFICSFVMLYLFGRHYVLISRDSIEIRNKLNKYFGGHVLRFAVESQPNRSSCLWNSKHPIQTIEWIYFSWVWICFPLVIWLLLLLFLLMWTACIEAVWTKIKSKSNHLASSMWKPIWWNLCPFRFCCSVSN